MGVINNKSLNHSTSNLGNYYSNNTGYLGNLGHVVVKELHELANNLNEVQMVGEYFNVAPFFFETDIPIRVKYFLNPPEGTLSEGFIWARLEIRNGHKALTIFFSSEELYEKFIVTFATHDEQMAVYETIAFHETIEINSGSHAEAAARTTGLYPQRDAQIKSLFGLDRVGKTNLDSQLESAPVFGVSTNGAAEEQQDKLSLVEKAPIEETETIIRRMAQTGPDVMEFGWFYGSSDDAEYFTSVYVPLTLGIIELANGNNFKGRTWDDKIRRRTLHKLLGDTFSVVVPYLAIRPETRQLGVQLISSIPENETGFRNRHSTFFPMEQLLLMKDIAEYLPEDVRGVISGMSDEQLYEYIRQQENEDNVFDHIIRINRPMLVGQYSMRQSYLPNNNTVISILKDNLVDGGTIIGKGHPHYLRTAAERAKNPFFNELDEIVHVKEVKVQVPGEVNPRTFKVGHERYISPPDANEIIFSKENIGEISRGELNSQIAVKAVFVFDPETRALLMTTYFDAIALSNNEEDRRRFVDLSVVASVTTSSEKMSEFYELVDKYTTEDPPAVILS